MGLFSKKKEKPYIPDSPTKRYEFTETGEKVLIDDNYKTESKGKQFFKKTFNEENKQKFLAGAKTTGGVVKRGAIKFAETQKAANIREERRSKSSSFGGGNDFMDLLGDSPRRGHRQQSEGRQASAADIQSSLLGSGNGPSANDITSSLLGTAGGKKRSKRSKKYDPFDFSDYY